ncbi:MAG: TonB-dependent receptor plug domain-containing protein [Coraliomargaritaceae bacterium]
MPDFVVTDDDDKGYYSANSLAGTRTNELTKNIPMTISTVNAEMIEDFKMKSLADLGNFVPSIEAEGSVYNNQEIRFRGLLTKNQLYEFMPRYSPLDWYNVGRSDIIRGANSLIYGQADPGGKVNVLSKTANFSKDKGSAVIEIGDKAWHKFTYDYNKVFGNKTAARFMFVDKHREFDANYKYQSFNGSTLEIEHRPQPNTRLRLHLETGEAERSLIGGTFKVGSSPTGLPNGIVADPKLADLVSDELLNEIAKYSSVNEFNGEDFDSIYPAASQGLASLYGYIDVNDDGRISANFTDWNGNNKYDYTNVYLNDTQSDPEAGNPLSFIRDRFGELVLDSNGAPQPLLDLSVPSWYPGTNEEYYASPFYNPQQIGSNNNGQPDPGEDTYSLIGRDNDGNLLPGIIDRAEIDPLVPGDIGGEPRILPNTDDDYFIVLEETDEYFILGSPFEDNLRSTAVYSSFFSEIESLYPSKYLDGSIIDPDQEYTDSSGDGIGYYPKDLYNYYLFVDQLGYSQVDPETGEPVIRTELNVDAILSSYYPDNTHLFSPNAGLIKDQFLNTNSELRLFVKDFTNESYYKGIPVSVSPPGPTIEIDKVFLDALVASIDAVIGERDAAIAERDARPTMESYDLLQTELASKYSLEEIGDLRLGSKIIDVIDNKINLSVIIEESNDLNSWNEGSTMSMEIPVEEGSNNKFYRFKMNDSESESIDGDPDSIYTF